MDRDFHTNRLDEQELAALSLHLLQICLIYTLSRDLVVIWESYKQIASWLSKSHESGVVKGLRPLTPKNWKALIRPLC